MNASGYYNTFTDRLTRLRQRELAVWTIIHIFKFILLSGPVIFAGILIENFLWLPGRYRIPVSLLIAFAVVTAGGFSAFHIFRAYTGRNKRFTIENLSRNVGAAFPKIRDKLVNGIQLYAELSAGSPYSSPALINDSMNRIGNAFNSYNFNKSIDYKPVRRLGKMSALFLTAVFGISVLTSGSLYTSAYRLAHPAKEFPIPASFTFTVFPGSVELIRGEPLRIVVNVDGEIPGSIKLYTQQNGKANLDSRDLENSENGSFTFDLAGVNEPFDYYVQGRDNDVSFLGRTIESDIFSVTVIHRPMVRMLNVLLDHPAYSGIGSNFLEENIGDISAVKGTRARIELSLNKPVAEALLQFNDGTTIPFSVNDMKAVASFSIDRSVRYTFALKDNKGITNSDPIEYKVTALDDAYPLLRLTSPGEDTDLTEDRQVVVGLKMSDDFGISGLRLGFKLGKPGDESVASLQTDIHSPVSGADSYTYTELPFESRSGAVQDVHFLWDMKKLQLFPEDEVVYFAEVFDNDAVSGPKRTRTMQFRLRLPSLQELFTQATEIQDEQEDKLTGLVEESKELQQELTELAHEFLKSGDVDWEQQKKTGDAIRKQEEIQNAVEEIKKKIEDLTQKFEENDLLSAQTLDKYKELQELMSELITPELRNMLQKLRESMQQTGDKEQKQEVLNNFRAAQEEYLERMDRTLKLLQKLQTEQMMDEIVARIENIAKTQEAINNELKSSENLSGQNAGREEERDILAKQESDLSRETDNLQNALEKLLEKAFEQPDIPSDDLGRTVESMEQQDISNRMDRMSGEIREGKLQSSQQSGKELAQDLRTLEKFLQDMQQQMAEGMKEEIVRDMRKSASNLLQLSKNQEALKSESGSLTSNSDNYRDIAGGQSELLSGLTRTVRDLVKLSEKTFFIPPELGRSITQSLRSMQESISKLEARDKNGAISNQDQSLQALNESINTLRTTIGQAKNSQTGIGFSEFLEKMEQLSGAQSGINEQTLPFSHGQGLTDEEMGAVLRLKRDQDILQKSLEELQQEVQGQGNLQEQLRQMNSEMQEIVRDMDDMNITDRTVRLQQRILSRMLDTQRSVHRRDFSKKRLAETAKFYENTDPGILPENLGEGIRPLEENLMQALREGFSRDFEELIRKYFDSLNRK